MTTSPQVTRALEALDRSWPKHTRDLEALVRIPGVSADPPPNPHLEKSAREVVRIFEEAGLEACEVISFPGGHPYAYGEWLHAEGAPTLLLYGHHDVQPPGRPEKWLSPAFEPTVRDGRMYGRGTVDDKAGVMVHVAAVAAYLSAHGALPVNVKFIVEGEEEAGSNSLEAFLEKYKEKLAADAIVLTDTGNFDTGIPSLTVSLRGIAALHVEVRGLEQPIHSGGSGPIPDPVQALCKAIAGLTDDEGRFALDVWSNVRPLDARTKAAVEEVPFDEASFRRDTGLRPGVKLVGNPGSSPWARTWWEPAVTVIALEARAIEGSSNQIVEAARARISVRIAPDQDPVAVLDAVEKHLRTRTPWGMEVKIEREPVAGWWITEAKGPAFDAAARALEAGYGRAPINIGCGGSIPFVEPFARVLGGVPALLIGVADPKCNAHSENESLHLGDWKKGARAAVYLYDELARALRS